MDYLIENSIELHSDKLDYILYTKVSTHLEDYVKLIRHSAIKNTSRNNIYQDKLDEFIVTLLGNELQNNPKLKLIPVGFETLLYLAERFD